GYPAILRKNRTSGAILDGGETDEELRGLSHDIFDYFGLGCRNVTKIFVPEWYDVTPLLQVMESFSGVIQINKYKNNYDYNLSIELLNITAILCNPYVVLKKNTEHISSPLGMLYYDH